MDTPGEDNHMSDTVRRFVLVGAVEESAFAAYLDDLYGEFDDLKPGGCEEATFSDFAEMVLDAACTEFSHTPLTFELTLETFGNASPVGETDTR
jgi:hypothetical protein